jgi:hypothetical protein
MPDRHARAKLGRSIEEDRIMAGDTNPTEDEPNEYASPACSRHEIDPAYLDPRPAPETPKPN